MSEAPKISAALPALVIVSGAASGLGTHIAGQLVDCGVATIGVDIAPQPKALERPLYRHVQGDVTQDKVWAAVVDEIRKAAPARIGLATSAAILEVGTILEFDRAALEKTMAVNFVGTALGIRAVLFYMIERGGGPIVTVASIDATFAEQQLSVYAASKGAVRQLARTVAMDHARQGVRVNVLRSDACGALRATHEVSERPGEIPRDARRAPAQWQNSRSSRRGEGGAVPALGRFRRGEWRGSDRRRRSHHKLRLPHRERRRLGLTDWPKRLAESEIGQQLRIAVPATISPSVFC